MTTLLPATGLLVAVAAPPDGAPSPWVQLIPFALVLAIFYFIILLPMRRRQKKIEEFLRGLKVGDKIITSGGLHGSITRLGEQTLQIQIADKVRVEIARSAVVGYQGQPPVAPQEGQAP
ncbi:MAG TPA: preprotein translocase subunit YajC [Vicinamibacterales bacterium]